MLTRRREQIIVLLGLMALNLGFGEMLSRYWKEYHANTQWIYAQRSIELAGAGGPQRTPVTAQSFADIVDRTIFRPERTNEASAETDKMPALPLLYGTMDLGEGAFALMAPGNQAYALSRPVHLGEEIGGYKLVSIADSQAVVERGEKQFTVNVWESARKVPRTVETPAPQPRAADSSASTPRTIVTAGGSGSTAQAAAGGGQQKTGFVGFNAPAGASPDAPVGTVIGGKRKVMHMTLFGPQYRWEDVEPPKDTTLPQNPPKEN